MREVNFSSVSNIVMSCFPHYQPQPDQKVKVMAKKEHLLTEIWDDRGWIEYAVVFNTKTGECRSVRDSIGYKEINRAKGLGLFCLGYNTILVVRLENVHGLREISVIVNPDLASIF